MRSLLLAGPFVFATALLHCSGTSNGVADGSDAAVRNPACPAAEPTAGAACAIADGTTCNNYSSAGNTSCYCCGGGAGGASYQCREGKWAALPRPSGGPPELRPQATCPITAPEKGSSCAPECGGGAQLTCNYDCAHGNGSVSSATCRGGSWEVFESLAPCEAADAGSDAADSGD